MKYVSTRGSAPALPFTEVLTAGLAPDGGLYVPDSLPHFSAKEIAAMAKLSYGELAYTIMAPFVGDAIPEKDFRDLIAKAYGTFRHSAIAPLKLFEKNQFVLELFHGPTLAFKDFALQLLGRMLDYTLAKQNQHIVILGATSGDTGSAAISGCVDSKFIQLFMLFPDGRVTDIQRRQMTTVLAPHIHNIAVAGTFDDCQTHVKAMFNDAAFLPGHKKVAVNSINWARIMAQIVYYFWAGLHLGAPHRPISFSVPTGNFGDIYAGWIAKSMGLPIEKLIVATNCNDILDRFFKANDYSQKGVTPSLSPSMDIQISSNFERLLFDLHKRDGKKIVTLMESFKSTGALKVDDAVYKKAKETFLSYKVDDAATLETMRNVFEKTGELLDPHSAIGYRAATKLFTDADHPIVTLATASPAKFRDAAVKAIGTEAPLPLHLKELMAGKERFTQLPNDLQKIQEFIKSAV